MSTIRNGEWDALRAVEPGRRKRVGVCPERRCDEPGCSELTREGKPFCLDHLHRMPEVARIGAWVRRNAARIRGGGA